MSKTVLELRLNILISKLTDYKIMKIKHQNSIMIKKATFIGKAIKYLDDIFDKFSPLELFIVGTILLIIAYQLKPSLISLGMPTLFVK